MMAYIPGPVTMLEKINRITECLHRAYSLTAFNIDKCPKADQVNNLNETRGWLLDAQSELEDLRREEGVHDEGKRVWEQAQREISKEARDETE